MTGSILSTNPKTISLHSRGNRTIQLIECCGLDQNISFSNPLHIAIRDSGIDTEVRHVQLANKQVPQNPQQFIDLFQSVFPPDGILKQDNKLKFELQNTVTIDSILSQFLQPPAPTNGLLQFTTEFHAIRFIIVECEHIEATVFGEQYLPILAIYDCHTNRLIANSSRRILNKHLSSFKLRYKTLALTPISIYENKNLLFHFQITRDDTSKQ